MGEDEIPIERLKLRDDPSILSPPIVAFPLYACATAVTVLSFVPHAELELEIAGTGLPVEPAGFPDPDGFTFTGIAALVAGQVMRARQTFGGATSDWSQPVTVGDHTADYPAGPPRPEINPEPVYECGSRTGVRNLLIGSNVWITADGTEVGRVDGAKEHQGVNVNPDYGLNQHVRAWADLCHDPSPPSVEYVTPPPPNPLPTPALDPAYEDGEQIRITNLVNGARFTIDRGGSLIGPFRTWGHAHLVILSPPFQTGETIAVTQQMCPSDPASDPGKTTVHPCSDLPAPKVAPIQVGDTVIFLTQWVVGAQIKVFGGMQKIGDGGGPVVALTRAVQEGETIYVYQVVGACVGSTATGVTALCVAPHIGGDPAGLNLFPTGHLDYAAGDVKGSVYYPAEDDGENQPFNQRWAGLGRSPIVFMAHGNHHTHHDPDDRENENSPNCGGALPPGWIEIPNHKGYDYFQRQLARMGLIAVSVDCNETNGCTANSLQNIERRADLIMGSIAHFQSLDTSGDAIFGSRIDFQRVGLMGHSRGGEAVVIAGNQSPGRLGVAVRAVISLAPVNHDTFTPADYAFATILPASDGDVSDNGGARFHDITPPAPFKCQLYIDWANHNYFNRQWITDEDGRVPPDVLTRGEHERILSRYGCAFFRAFLLNHNTTAFLAYRVHPSGISTGNVHLSFEWKDQLTVDDHEQAGGIAQNTLGRPTSQAGGMSADEFELRRSTPNSYPTNSFWGRTVGMVMTSRRGGIFRSELDQNYDLDDPRYEIWVRTAEVSEGGSNPAGATGFEMGLEDSSGQRAWASSDTVGGVPRPFDQSPGSTKTMLTTLRFPVRCFKPEKERLDLGALQAILVRYDRADNRALGFDILQIVRE
jgi:hypothetical protein